MSVTYAVAPVRTGLPTATRREPQPAIEILHARPQALAAQIRDLYWEYLQWANGRLKVEYGIDLDIEAMLEQDLREIEKFLPPKGRLLLAHYDGQLAGTASLKALDGETGAFGATGTTGEIKRLYVRPPLRRRGIGRALISRLVGEARPIGYTRILLDSAGYMTGAHALYRSLGFREIAPYAGSEIPKQFQAHWVFVKRVLE